PPRTVALSLTALRRHLPSPSASIAPLRRWIWRRHDAQSGSDSTVTRASRTSARGLAGLAWAHGGAQPRVASLGTRRLQKCAACEGRRHSGGEGSTQLMSRRLDPVSTDALHHEIDGAKSGDTEVLAT
ncbi:unnamed protein product, partial [Urochloa humidicola]